MKLEGSGQGFMHQGISPPTPTPDFAPNLFQYLSYKPSGERELTKRNLTGLKLKTFLGKHIPKTSVIHIINSCSSPTKKKCLIKPCWGIAFMHMHIACTLLGCKMCCYLSLMPLVSSPATPTTMKKHLVLGCADSARYVIS